jgi:predicted deacylase
MVAVFGSNVKEYKTRGETVNMIDELKAAAGEKKQVMLLIIDGKIKLPVTIIEGDQAGETLLITSGIHCAEYTGIEAAIELAQELAPKQIKGRVILIHPVNITGFEGCEYNSNVPEDNKNLNRVFPGNSEGSMAERLADYVVKNFHSLADCYIDMHGGNVHEDLSPYVYYVTAAKPEVRERAKQMAKRVHVDYMVGSKVGSQGSYNYAGFCGISSILMERGSKGVWNPKEVDLYKEDVRNVMRYLGILIDGKQDAIYEPANIETVHELNVNQTGCWYPKKRAGEIIKKGELLGEIKDYFGKVKESFYCEEDGIILYQTCSLCVGMQSNIITYGVNK